MIGRVEPRRSLVPVLLLALLACDDDDEAPREVVTPPSFDASLADRSLPAADATCQTSVGVQDFDGDGLGPGDGDCDDCDARRGPGSWELPGNGIDDDCDSLVDEPADSCDARLDPSETAADKALGALGLCGGPVGLFSHKQGLIEASFSRLGGKTGLGDPRQLWLPDKFGTILPREGARLMALSTGVARDVNDDGYTKPCDVFGSELDMSGSWSGGQVPPSGFPRDAKACGKDPVSGGALAYDSVVLDLTLRAPNNASAFAFDSLFLTYEYPDFVCSRFNDFFVVLMDPPAPEADDDGNILFDSQGDPVGVNSGLLSACRTSSRAARKVACDAGPALLKDTGYDRFESVCAPLVAGEQNLGGASTGWLHTQMPVTPGKTFKLRFVLWDSGDPLLDATVLLDNFGFLEAAPSAGTTPIISG